MKLCLTLLKFFIPLSIFSQSTVKDTLYYNSSWELTSKDYATYYRMVDIKNGKFDGKFKDYYIPNNRVVSTGYYTDGKLSEGYHERDTSGVVLIDGYFENGRKSGFWIFNYPSGKLKAKVNFENNQTRILSFYDSNGNHMIIDGNGSMEFNVVFSGGKAIVTVACKNGLKHGKWTYFTPSDNKFVIVEKYRKGKFRSGKNLIINKPYFKPLLYLSDMFYSDRVFNTDRYTVSNKVDIAQIPKISHFFANLDDHFKLIDNNSIKYFPDDKIKLIEIDKYQNVWFSTEKSGFFSLKDSVLEGYRIQNNSVRIESIHADKEGDVWVSYEKSYNYEKSGLLRISNGVNKIYNTKNSDLTCNLIRSICSTNDTLYFGTRNCINVFDKRENKWSILQNSIIHTDILDTTQILSNKQYEKFRTNRQHNYFRSICMYDQKLWVSSFDGLFEYDKGLIMLYDKDNFDFIKSNWISKIQKYDDKLLITFDGGEKSGGLAIYDGNVWKNLNVGNSVLTRNRISECAVGPNGAFWLNSSPNSLICLQNNRVIKYGYDNVVYKNSINNLVFDSCGNLYLATNKGIQVMTVKKNVK